MGIKDIQVLGDQIIVRGEATGTPTAEFWGARPTGKSFNTMALDIFTVRNGKPRIVLSRRELDDGVAADRRVRGGLSTAVRKYDVV